MMKKPFNSHLVMKIEINRIRKNFVKLMSVKTFSYILRKIDTGFKRVWSASLNGLASTFCNLIALSRKRPFGKLDVDMYLI